MLTSVLVPTWNALELTRVALEQLAARTTAPFELVVVDNGSADGTWPWLRAWKRRARSPFLRGVTLLRHLVNRGYAAAMNRAYAASRGEQVVFANADAAPGPFWLEEMTSVFDERRRLGGLAPSSNRLQGRSPRTPPWAAPPLYRDLQQMARLAGAWALQPRAERFVRGDGFVPGFWFMTRRAVLERVGLFDERFFPGSFEDIDLQYRMRLAGYELGWAGRAFVHHAWFGVARRNGLTEKALYAPNKKLFNEKNPRAHGLYMTYWTPALVTSGSPRP